MTWLYNEEVISSTRIKGRAFAQAKLRQCIDKFNKSDRRKNEVGSLLREETKMSNKDSIRKGSQSGLSQREVIYRTGSLDQRAQVRGSSPGEE